MKTIWRPLFNLISRLLYFWVAVYTFFCVLSLNLVSPLLCPPHHNKGCKSSLSSRIYKCAAGADQLIGITGADIFSRGTAIRVHYLSEGINNKYQLFKNQNDTSTAILVVHKQPKQIFFKLLNKNKSITTKKS